MKYRRQVPIIPPDALVPGGGPQQPAPAGDPVDGLIKLQPLASRLAVAASGSAALAESAPVEIELPEEEPVAPRSRIVTLVSPWTGDDDETEPEEGAPEPADEADPVALEEKPFEPDLDEDDADGDGPVALRLDVAGLEAEPEDDSHPAASTRIPKVLVVDRLGSLSYDIERIASSLNPVPKVVKLTRPTELVETAAAEDPDVLVVSPEEMTATGLKRLAHVHKAQPRVLILLSDNDRTWPASQIAATGASDFLPARPSRPKLKAKLSDALGTAAHLRVESIVVTERIVIHEPAPPQPAVAPVPQTLARMFTVASPTGGSGKTTVAANLASYLASDPGRRVLLVDLDLQFGGLGSTLHLHPTRSIADLADDPTDLPEMLVEHAAGFKVLCAPADPLQAEALGPEQVSAILDAARLHFDFVVVDTAPVLNEICLAAFDRSEKVLVLANLDVPSLKNMRRYLETIENLGVSEEQAELVVNRSDSGIGLELKGVTQLFKQGFLAVLPAAKDVPWSTNMGNPIVRANPKAEISRQLNDAFTKLVPPAGGPNVEPKKKDQGPRKAGLLGRKKGKS